MSTSKQIIPLKEYPSTEAPEPIIKPNKSQRILDEDSYVNNIEHIITRDFYPDLHRLNQQNDKNNVNQYVIFKLFHPFTISIQPTKHYQRYNTPKHANLDSPIKQSHSNNKPPQQQQQSNTNSFENAITPTPNQSNSIPHNVVYSDNDSEDEEAHYVNGEELSQMEKKQMQCLKLNDFHSLYTSEDNYSFSEIMYKNQKEHIAKHEWIYKQQKNAKNRQKYLTILKQQNHQNDKNEKKLVPQIELPQTKNEKLSNSELIKLQNKKRYENELEIEKNVNLYRGELEYWKYRAINDLMFFPETDKNLNSKMMNEVYAKYGKPECIYPNTRLPQKFKLEKPSKNELSEMEKQCKGYEFVYEHVNESPIALNENDQPKGPLFHIAALPKKDKIVHALNKKKSDKMKKKQEENRRYTTPKTGDIYTPYHTKSVLTPSGNRIDTPLVGQNLSKRKRSKKDNVSRKSPKRRGMASSIRSVDNLSPAARKLMEMRMKGNDRLSTPLSTALRDAYSITPNTMKRSKRIRTREYSVDSVRSIDTPQCTPKQKKRRMNESEFMKPTQSLTSRHNKKKHSANITDGLL